MSNKADTSHLPGWARAKDQRALKLYQKETEKGLYDLTPDEKWWRDHYHMLERHGYRLRIRYHPDWIPSWVGTNANPLYCEDSLLHFVSCTILCHCLRTESRSLLFQIKPVMDAVRMEDAMVVAIKYISANSEEVELGRFLSSREMLAKKDNHCVPLLDDFQDDDEPNKHFIVMSLLRQFDDPPFYAVKEVVDFIEQTLRVGIST